MRRLHAEGAQLVIGDVNEAGMNAVAAEVGVTAIPFDLTTPSSITRLIDSASRQLGGLDGLVNVAADVSPEQMSRDIEVATMDVETWQHALNANLIGVAWAARAVIPHLVDAGGGAIVNVTSDATATGYPVPPAYAASKAGINTVTRHVAVRWGEEKIRCNAISPGPVASEKMLAMGEDYMAEMLKGTPLRRLGEPADLAASIAFLMSDDGAWVTGQVWSVNGGTLLRE